jgi:hypothetical protein
MEKIKIVCPSMGRADDVLTNKIVKDLIIVCPEDEVDKYKEYNDNEIIGHPKEVKGITATRQFIIETFENVFMLDDDVLVMRKLYDETPYDTRDNEEIVNVINRTADTCRQIGAYYFGFSSYRQPKDFKSQKPFRFTGFVSGSNTGFLKGHNLKYDIGISDADDYYMSCMNVYKNRYMCIDMRYAFVTYENFNCKGGAAQYRNSNTMKEDTLYLRELFGEVIHMKKPTNSKKNIIEGERSLKFPI